MPYIINRSLDKSWSRDRVARPLDRSEKLDLFIKKNDIISEDDLFKMSFNKIESTLIRYAKKAGIKFEYIGNGKYVILK
jgi:hypothetical protein